MSARDAIHRALVRRYGTSGPADVDAILAALSAAGLAVLPVEPTKAMVDAAIDRDATYDGKTIYHGVYRAMLAAAKEDRDDA